jgi:hypothetical protein
MAACRRQCTACPGDDDAFMDRIEAFFVRTILPEITDLFLNNGSKGFQYSSNVWYNHLTAEQQAKIDNIDLETLMQRFAKEFCKCEKQPMEGCIFPKNRCISALCEQHKWVMGPVIYALEQYFKSFTGYCGGATWEDLAHSYDQWESLGLTCLIQSDFSGMDRTVRRRLMQLIEMIYEHITPAIYHVPEDVWRRHAFVQKTTVYAEMFTKDGKLDFGSALITDTVFSGECSTTWKNTVVTIILHRFVIEELLGYTPDEYGIKAKGDDSEVVLPAGANTGNIRSAYSKAFYSADNFKWKFLPYFGYHGCGMTIKFLSISDSLTDADFCSTSTFHCAGCNHYRITRKLDRFIYLSCYSENVLSLNSQQRYAYMQNLYISNLNWMDNLPIFRAVNELLHTKVYTDYSLVGRNKAVLPLSLDEQLWKDSLFSKHSDSKIHDLQIRFGKNAAHTIVNQLTTILPCCVSSYYNHLFVKYGLNATAISSIESAISTSTGHTYTSNHLSLGLSAFDDHVSSLRLT